MSGWMYDAQTLQDAINTYGANAQIVVAVEELSELIKELTKHLRGIGDVNHISEEMADVKIMLEQLEMIFNNRYEIRDWRGKKIRRLHSRLHDKEIKEFDEKGFIE